MMAQQAAIVIDAAAADAPRQAVTDGWTLRTLLDEMSARGSHPALICFADGQAQTLSYADLVDDSRRLASGLVAAGVEPGTAVALWAPNSPEWVMLRLAIGAIGALAITIDDLAGPQDAAAILRDAGCQWLFASPAHAGTLKQHKGRLAIFVIDRSAFGRSSSQDWRALLAEKPAPLPAVQSDDPAMLVYTSGTTGAPKCFTLTSANVWANLGALREKHLIGPTDRVLLPLPLHHAYPFIIGLLMPLVSGATVVLPEAVAGTELAHALRTAGVSAIVGVPRLYAAIVAALEAGVAARGAWLRHGFEALLGASLWLRRRFGARIGRRLFRGLHARFAPNLRLLVAGGARIDPDLAWKLEALGWLVLSGYGLAETASMFTGNLPQHQRIGSEGRALQHGAIRIAAPDATGVGEIELKGPNVFSGYRNNPEATRAAFTADGWFRTGDLGALDADGFLTVTGRATELIVLGGGKHFFPDDLERKYAASPFIEEIAILEQAGALVALVRPNIEAMRTAGRLAIEDALRVSLGEISRDLPAYQRLAGFAIARAPLPRTRLGKYRRFLLPELYRQARTGAAAAPSEELSAEDCAVLAASPAREVWELLKTRYPTRFSTLDASPLLDLGIDSLERLSLALELEARFHLRVREAELAEAETVRDLLRVITKAAQSQPAGEEAEPSAVPSAPPPVGPLGRLVGLAAYGLNRLIMRLGFRLRVAGRNTLPQLGGYIVVANHVSDLDPLALAAALPYRHMRRVFWGGDAAYLFWIPLSGPFWRALHVFAVDERKPAEALARATAVLAAGNALIWFPEGWRSPTGELQHFLPGIGKIVTESGRPVVPAYIQGTFEALPRGRRWPRRHPIAVRFGAPIEFRASAGGTPEQGYAQIADTLHDAVAELAPASLIRPPTEASRKL
ncbi:MAG TPA: AMP-binding protein, partial [Stellaceae bacterium]|nr:AMP-binding protein [Stellaceae bacterium]